MKLRSKFFEKPACASALALSTLAIALPVAAQEQQTSENVDEVVVTGIRRQLETSQARKQEASELVDAITADDIGALPDRSVTEVLQRISGPGHRPRAAAARCGPHRHRRLRRHHSWLELGAQRAQRPHGVLRKKQPHARIRRHSARVARRRRCLQESFGPAGRRRPLRHREPAHPAALRFRRPQVQLLGRGIPRRPGEEWEPSGSVLFSDRTGKLRSATSVRSFPSSYSDLTSRTDTIHIEKYYATRQRDGTTNVSSARPDHLCARAALAGAS